MKTATQISLEDTEICKTYPSLKILALKAPEDDSSLDLQSLEEH